MGRNHIHYLDGLKGLACVLIMVCHYFDLYRYATVFEPAIAGADRFLASRAAFLCQEGFWLYLFFVTSGFLLGRKEIPDVLSFLRACVMRFVRLGLPILFASLVIWMIGLTLGFHNAATASLFENQWFQLGYPEPVTLLDVLRSPVDVLLLGQSWINAPYWVLQRMLLASFLIYLLQLICRTFSPVVRIFIVLALMLLLGSGEPIIAACLAGMLTSILLPHAGRSTAVLSGIAAVFFLILYLFSLTRLPAYTKLLSGLFFAAFLMLTASMYKLGRCFSAAPLLDLGKISWGVYSFHWPLMCSFGSLFLLARGISAFPLSCFLCAALTLLLAVAFYFTLEKLAGSLTQRIGAMLSHTGA